MNLICLASDSRFFPAACATAFQISSMLQSATAVAVLCHGVDEAEVEHAKNIHADIDFVDVSFIATGSLRTDDRISLASYVRIFLDKIPALDEYNRILYCDSDIYFRKNPETLFSLSDENAALAAAYDLSEMVHDAYQGRLQLKADAPYFNAGLLLLNMPRIREHGFLATARDFASRNPEACLGHDQDALNHAFGGQWNVLDWRWNVMSDALLPYIPKSEIYGRHFIGRKPWQRGRGNASIEEIGIYRDLFRQSGWETRFDKMTARERLQFTSKRIGRALELGVKNAAARLLRGQFNKRHVRRLALIGHLDAVQAEIERQAAEGEIANGKAILAAAGL